MLRFSSRVRALVILPIIVAALAVCAPSAHAVVEPVISDVQALNNGPVFQVTGTLDASDTASIYLNDAACVGVPDVVGVTPGQFAAGVNLVTKVRTIAAQTISVVANDGITDSSCVADTASRTAVTASTLAAALDLPMGSLTGSSFIEQPASAIGAIASTGLNSILPRMGASMAVLSTGDAHELLVDNNPPGINTGGGASHGGTYDATSLRLDLDAPDATNCFYASAYYLTDDAPDPAPMTTPGWYFDPFVAEVDGTNAWVQTDVGRVATAAGFGLLGANVYDATALVDGSNVLLPNVGGSLRGGTVFGAGSGWFRISTPMTPGSHQVDFALGDRTDASGDTVLVLDDAGFVLREAGACTKLANPTDDFVAPVVTLDAPSTGATFAGDAGNLSGDDATVTVNLYEGATASGAPDRTVTGTAAGTEWTTSTLSPALTAGQWTAQVEQHDSEGNIGLSSTATFTAPAPPTTDPGTTTPPTTDPGTTTPPADTTAPTAHVFLKLATTASNVLKRGHTFTVTCGERSTVVSKLTLRGADAKALKLQAGTSPVTVGTATKSCVRRATMTIKLNTRGRKAINRRGARVLRLPLLIKVRDAAGNTRVLGRTIIVR